MASRLTPLERALRAVTEDEWRDQVVDAAHTFGWSVAYFRPGQTNHGWRTPVGADGKGWPDLTLVRERVVFAELKREQGELEPEQELWRERLLGACQEWHLWRPSDMDEVIAVLRRYGMP